MKDKTKKDELVDKRDKCNSDPYLLTDEEEDKPANKPTLNINGIYGE